METEQFITKMRTIQSAILTYIEEEDVSGSNYAKLNKIFDDFQIRSNKNEFKLLLHLLSNISNHHHRFPDFFTKIFQILKDLQKEIKTFFSNLSIFNIFRKNKRILLYLIDERILIIDKYISSIITTNKYAKFYYPEYFLTEILPFLNENYAYSLMNNMPEEYEKYRRIGEGYYIMIELIIKDNVDDFISFVKQKDLPLNYIMTESKIVETNPVLINSQPSFIEYAFFYGSINIINYLIENGIELTSSLWIYAIHSNNLNVLHILENKDVILPKKSLKGVIWESIKCHHIEMTKYIISKYYKVLDSKSYFMKSLKYYNFHFIDEKLVDESRFYSFCKYDYFYLANKFMEENEDIDINDTKVL